jgi:transposase
VPVRSIENQAELMRHRARELLAGERTSLLNALRGHMEEIVVVALLGAQHAYHLKRIAADGFDDNGEIMVPDCVRVALRPLIGQIDALDQAIAAIDRELAASVKANETARRFMTIPGVGQVTASAIVATPQDMSAFASGRGFSAFLGLTRRQSSSGVGQELTLSRSRRSLSRPDRQNPNRRQPLTPPRTPWLWRHPRTRCPGHLTPAPAHSFS